MLGVQRESPKQGLTGLCPALGDVENKASFSPLMECNMGLHVLPAPPPPTAVTSVGDRTRGLRRKERKAHHFPVSVAVPRVLCIACLFFVFRGDLGGQLMDWHGNLFISAKQDSQNESVRLFERHRSSSLCKTPPGCVTGASCRRSQ